MKRSKLIKMQDIAFGTIAISSLFLLVGASGANAATSAVDEVTITVPASCSLTNTIGSAHTATIETGVYQDDIGETTFKVFCNDNEGFAVYAVGYTNDEFGNTTMKPSTLAVSNAITTGTATSGNTSNWAMKLTAVSGDYAPTLETGFNDCHVIPDTYTKVASYASNTDSSTGSSFKSTYSAFISQTQPADSYTGKVKYTVVHPANGDAPMSSIGSLTYMQDFNELTPSQRTSVLNSMAYNTTYELIDNRDNKTYQVVKLKDDNIWMAENLDLGRTAITGNLTGANTNLDTDVATIATSAFNTWIKTSGTHTSTSAELIPVAGTDSTSNTPYGTLYNYCAASAGTICSEEDANGNNATSDICPAGWRLPTGGNSGEFKTLYSLADYNTNAKIRAPITDGGAAFALAGYFYDFVPQNQGYDSDYWSSTRSDSMLMHALSISRSNIYPTGGYGRYYGASVRCIAKKPIYSLNISYGTGISSVKVNGKTIQNGKTINLERNTHQIIAMLSPGYGFSSWSATSGQVDNVSTQVTAYTLNNNATISATASYVATEMQNLSQSNCTTTPSRVRDIRDNHVYTIQRLKDGKCWMMENLDLGRTELTADLTSSNTNLASTIIASTFNSWKKTNRTQTYTDGEFISVDGGDSISGTPYGTLYNYCSASAGTICSAENSNNDEPVSDLCPAGWRLPTGGNSGEFKTLYGLADYNTNAKMRAPITDSGAAFALAGDFGVYPIPDNQNSIGLYWSSNRYSGSSMYCLYLDANNVGPSNTYSRDHGNAVRCISDI